MEGIVGMIKLALGPHESREWLLCDGRVLGMTEAPELAALVGTKFGGEGKDGFRLPLLPPQAEAHFLLKARPGAGDAAYQGYVGQMVYWVGESLPKNWEPCDGRLVKGAQYPVLQRVAAGPNANTGPEEFFLPTVPELMPGVRCIICMEGIDPGAAPGAAESDDDI